MKREFGSKLIEQVLPRLDLTHVIDTSGAYIPGPRHADGDPVRPAPRAGGRRSVRTVMGIKGEPSTPDDPAQGLVWSAIVDQIDQVGIGERVRQRGGHAAGDFREASVEHRRGWRADSEEID